MIEKKFDKEKLYNDIVHFYMDKKRYPPDKANRIAQKVVIRETNKRRCATCGHMNYDHIANTKACLYVDCQCTHFVKKA